MVHEIVDDLLILLLGWSRPKNTVIEPDVEVLKKGKQSFDYQDTGPPKTPSTLSIEGKSLIDPVIVL